jgi:hypothetical protein
MRSVALWFGGLAAMLGLFVGLLCVLASDAYADQCSAPQAVPSTVTVPNSTFYSDGMPPVRFQGGAKVSVQFATQVDINDQCGIAPCKMVTLACTKANNGPLILPNPCSYGANDAYAKLVCHELAHRNGWPATHGD